MSLFYSRARLLLGLLFVCSFSAPPAYAAGLCLTVDAGGGELFSLPVARGGELRLRFLNSVYGSSVVEIFTLAKEGLQSSRLLYAEERVAEFYGHEAASYEEGLWVVRPEPRRFNPLVLRASGDAAIELFLDGKAVPLRGIGQRGLSVALAVASCEANGG